VQADVLISFQPGCFHRYPEVLLLLMTSWTLLSEALQYVKYIGLIRALETLAYLNSLPYTLLPIIMVP